MGDYLIRWRKFIDSGLSLREQLKEFTPWAKALEKFIKLEEEKTIKITNLRDFPSSITWHVLSKEAYQKARREWSPRLIESIESASVAAPIGFPKRSSWLNKFRS